MANEHEYKTVPDTEYYSNNRVNSYNILSNKSESEKCCFCCPRSCVENALLICNILIFMLGGGFLGLGVYLLINQQSYMSVLVGHLLFSGHYLVIGTGGLVVLVAVLGCVGALRKSVNFLRAYTILLFVMLVFQVTAGALSLTFGIQLQQRVTDSLKQNMLSANFDAQGISNDVRAKQVDLVHKELRCCGSKSFDDWKLSTFSERHNASFSSDSPRLLGAFSQNRLLTPISCCLSPGKSCSASSHPNNLYLRGCSSAITERLRQDFELLAPVAFSIGVIQLLGLIMACAFLNVLSPKRTTR